MSESSEEKHIVIRKIKKVKHGGHHGGAWKLAYADFVTAMMAFFLLLWLLSLLNKYQLSGVGEYFKKPLKDIFNKSEHVQPQSSKHLIGTQEKPGTTKQPMQQEKNMSKDTTSPKSNDMKKAAELSQVTHIKQSIDKKIQSNAVLKDFKNQLNVEVTKQGLKITLKDLENNPMFSKGESEFVAKADKIFPLIASEINKYKNKILIIGHTDAGQYQDKIDYTNWELSADRANATRRYLLKNGVDGSRFLDIQAMADVAPLDKKNPYASVNRRIEIIVLNNDAASELINQ